MPILDAVRTLRRAARRRRLRATGDALLSVVVPVYRVAAYLDSTLTNLAEQTYRSVEVIVVDDGSPDESAAIAAAWCRRDPRFRLVRRENGGPSAARNEGIRHATGHYLAFVDGDDTLPPDAWSLLVGSLERTGSDFAVGRIERDENGRRWVTRRMERNHAERRQRLRVEELPEILADVFPVNKVFRRDFWDRLDLSFPEGHFYEDQPVMTRAFLAGTFDVLPETVYWYLVRGDGTSVTQLRHRIDDLRDRIATKQMSVESVLAHGAAQVSRTFFADVLPVDMWEYFRSVPGCTEEYWTLLRAAVLEFWNDATVPFPETLVPVQQRLMGWFVAQGRRADLERLIAFIDTEGVVTEDRDGVRVFAHPWREEPGLPRGCLVV